MANSYAQELMRRLTGVATLYGIVLMGPAVPTVLAAPPPQAGSPQQYLALGDSVAFGYNPYVAPQNAENFIGYPTPAAAALKKTLTNASCVGETSSHFITLTGSDNGCGTWRFLLSLPLHVQYTTSQLAFADTFLQANRNTHLVSIDIGSNDVFVLENGCQGNVECIQEGLPGVLATLSANLDTIYGHIRNLDGYKNKLVALTYYSLNYGDPVVTEITSEVNQVVQDRTRAWGGIVADGFTAFEIASTAYNGDPCAAGLLIKNQDGTCNIHPSADGRDLLAQAIVNALRVD